MNGPATPRHLIYTHPYPQPPRPNKPHAQQDPVIVSFARTPIGKFQGGLAGLSAPQLGATAVKEAVNRACALSALLAFGSVFVRVLYDGQGANTAPPACIFGHVSC